MWTGECSPDNSHVGWMITLFVAVFIFFLVLIMCLTSGNPWLAIILLPIAELAYWRDAFASRCPRCCAWWAREKVGEVRVGETERRERVLLTCRTYDGEGNLIGKEETWDYGRVREETYREVYRCMKCGHRWESGERRRVVGTYRVVERESVLRDRSGRVVGKRICEVIEQP